MIAYLSGPMRGKPDYNRAAFEDASAKLRAAGQQGISPVEMNDHMCPGWNVWPEAEVTKIIPSLLRRDLTLLCSGRIDTVIVLPGHEDSEGCKIEVAVARAIGIPILPLDIVLANLPKVEPVVDVPTPTSPPPDLKIAKPDLVDADFEEEDDDEE